MKKFNFKLKKRPAEPASTRITNETVAEHREQVLAGGRKFKYPVQYARHKLVINASVLAFLALAALAIFTWFQLYVAQSSNTFFYRISRIAPVPVASVDQEQVRYSDYLRAFRGSKYYLVNVEQVKENTEGGQQQIDYIKRVCLTNAEVSAYAKKIARQNKLSVTQQEINDALNATKQSQSGSISDDVIRYSAQNIFDWTDSEAREALRDELFVRKVKYLVDDTAKNKANQGAQLIKADSSDFQKIADQLKDDTYNVRVGMSGMVSVSGPSGELSTEAAKLEKGQVSGIVQSNQGDGYYFLKLLEKTDDKVNYEYIHIPLQKFMKQFNSIKQDGRIKEYITVKNIEAPQGVNPESSQ